MQWFDRQDSNSVVSCAAGSTGRAVCVNGNNLDAEALLQQFLVERVGACRISLFLQAFGMAILLGVNEATYFTLLLEDAVACGVLEFKYENVLVRVRHHFAVYFNKRAGVQSLVRIQTVTDLDVEWGEDGVAIDKAKTGGDRVRGIGTVQHGTVVFRIQKKERITWQRERGVQRPENGFGAFARVIRVVDLVDRIGVFIGLAATVEASRKRGTSCNNRQERCFFNIDHVCLYLSDCYFREDLSTLARLNDCLNGMVP